MSWFTRLANLVRSDALSRELDREMEFHLAERADELVAGGMSREEAMREARRRFGNPALQKERTRDVDVLTWLESLAADVRYALRALWASPGFAMVVVLSLALGIGANTAIFTLVDAVLLRPLPVRDPEELLLVRRGGEGTENISNPLWEQLRERRDLFAEAAATADDITFDLTDGGESRRVRGSWVSGGFFRMLGVRPAVGRLLGREDDVRGCPAVAVLSYGFWQRELGGARDAVGKTISLEHHPYEIVGVTEPEFFGVTVGSTTQVYTPLCTEPLTPGRVSMLDSRVAQFLRVLARPLPGATLAQTRARLATAAPALYAATAPRALSGEAYQAHIHRPLDVVPAATGMSAIRREYRRALVSLMVVVVVVLLIACANVANLLLARGTARQREIAVRLSLGAGPLRLVRQLLTESLVLSLLGAIVGIGVAQWGSRLLVGLLSTRADPVWLDLSVDGRVLAFTVAVATVVGLLFGLAPAWNAARVSPQAAMAAGSRSIAGGPARFAVGKALVSAQVALALVLVVGAGLLLETFRTLATLDPGFHRDGVLLVNVNLQNAGYADAQLPLARRAVLERLRAIPGVHGASASTLPPITPVSWSDPIDIEHGPSLHGDEAVARFNEVTDGFFATMGIPRVAGRDFTSRDTPGSPKVAIVSERLARRFFGGASPLGRRFRIRPDDDGEVTKPGSWYEIVGVVRDAKYRSLRETAQATAYFALGQLDEASVHVRAQVRAAGRAESMISAVTAAMAEVSPRISLQYSTLAEVIDASLRRERLLATLAGFFGALALALAVVGLYGTIAYAVTRRRTEIGVRIALGAAGPRVLRMVLGEVARILAIGVALGVLAALATTRFVSSFLFGLTPTDPATMAFAAAALVVAGLAAGALPAWRAARVDPTVALREE